MHTHSQQRHRSNNCKFPSFSDSSLAVPVKLYCEWKLTSKIRLRLLLTLYECVWEVNCKRTSCYYILKLIYSYSLEQTVVISVSFIFLLVSYNGVGISFLKEQLSEGGYTAYFKIYVGHSLLRVNH